MADWEITATTVYCEAVDDEVTLLIDFGGTTTCTGQQRFDCPDKENARLLEEKTRQAGRVLTCAGTDCTIISQYRTRILTEANPG
ncbi:MAG: hypothetical protein MUO19_07690 [Dehalococcoidales bacterium]|nr:hypothetical protein [Dehalococcoidales bacterium]